MYYYVVNQYCTSKYKMLKVVYGMVIIAGNMLKLLQMYRESVRRFRTLPNRCDPLHLHFGSCKSTREELPFPGSFSVESTLPLRDLMVNNQAGNGDMYLDYRNETSRFSFTQQYSSYDSVVEVQPQSR